MQTHKNEPLDIDQREEDSSGSSERQRKTSIRGPTAEVGLQGKVDSWKGAELTAGITGVDIREKTGQSKLKIFNAEAHAERKEAFVGIKTKTQLVDVESTSKAGPLNVKVGYSIHFDVEVGAGYKEGNVEAAAMLGETGGKVKAGRDGLAVEAGLGVAHIGVRGGFHVGKESVSIKASFHGVKGEVEADPEEVKQASVDAACKGKKAVMDGAVEVKHTTMDAAYKGKEAVMDGAAEVKRTTMDTAYKGKEAVMDGAVEVKRTTMDAAYKGKEAVMDGAVEVKRTTMDAAYKGKEAVIDGAVEVKRTTMDVAYKGKEAVTDIGKTAVMEARRTSQGIVSSVKKEFESVASTSWKGIGKLFR